MLNPTTDATPAASSPAPVVEAPAALSPAEAFELDQLSEAEYDKWLTEGTPLPAKADSEPAKTHSATDQVEKVAPASDAVDKQARPRADGETRKTELAAEIADLLKQRAALRAEVAPKPEATPAAKPKEAAKAPEIPTDPNDGETWGQFEARRNQAISDLADFKATEAVRKDREEQAERATQTRIADENARMEKDWSERVEAVKAKNADFEAVVKAADIPIGKVMDGYLLWSRAGAELLLHLSRNPTLAEDINAMSAFQAAATLRDLEVSLTSEQKAPEPAISKAPRPAANIGGKKPITTDPLKALVESGEYSEEYERLANEAEIRQRKRA